jgi:hypothetical protein
MYGNPAIERRQAADLVEEARYESHRLIAGAQETIVHSRQLIEESLRLIELSCQRASSLGNRQQRWLGPTRLPSGRLG